jgi:protease-4
MKKIFRTIGSLFRLFWKSVTTLREMFFNLIFILLMFLFIVVLVSSFVKSVPKKAALVIAPTGKIVEKTAESLLVDRFFNASKGAETVLADIIDTIDYARNDKNISALVLELEDLGPVGISQLQEIGSALNRFKESGKTVVASGNRFNQQQYYLAAHADRLYLHPMGQIWLSGFGVYRQYIKRALDKLQIDFHVFREGTYKSALEPFVRNDMSAADRESITAWLTNLWDTYSSEVAGLRGISAESINDYINNMADHLKEFDGDAAQMALKFSLVDGLKTKDEIHNELIQLVGEAETEGLYKSVTFGNYAQIALPKTRRVQPDQDRVAIIVAEGIIMDGSQPAGRIGAESMSELIRQARDDEQIKAVVLRINSGGGSAMASEIIRRELELTRLDGKPVVVSMSSVAASGAYWVSVAANEIWANPTTITGSIGIFAALPTFDRSFDAIGITTDGVGTTRLSGAFNLSRPLNPLLSETLSLNISQGYKQFIDRVMTGRHMSVEDVEKVAQGRVWAAKTAHEIGLIDQLGGLSEAVKSAAQLANLDAYNVIYVDKPISAKERILRKIRRMVMQMTDAIFQPVNLSTIRLNLPGLPGRELEALFQLNDPGHLYALCLTCTAFGF